jgi:uncharacterized protein
MALPVTSKILLHPGLWNSGEAHWQSHWEKTYGFERILQDNWDTPVCAEWIARLDEIVLQNNPEQVILVGHSLACATIVFWAKQYNRRIKGALLVAPSDTEGPVYPDCTTGFQPMPLHPLPFPSIVINSLDDVYVSPERARQFAQAWGSELVEIDGYGHINSDSNLGLWPFGYDQLLRLDTAV